MGEFLCLLLNNIIYFGRSKGDSLVFDFSRILPDIQSCLRRSPSCLFSLLLLFVFGFVLVLGPDLEAVCGIRILGLKGFKVHGQDRDELAGCRVRPWQSGACAARSLSSGAQMTIAGHCCEQSWQTSGLPGCVKFLSLEMLITPSSWKWSKTKTPSILQAKENTSP